MFFVRTIGKKYEETALIKLIVIGLLIGIIIALTTPALVPIVSILGDLFGKALKGVAPILVFVLVLYGTALLRTEINRPLGQFGSLQIFSIRFLR